MLAGFADNGLDHRLEEYLALAGEHQRIRVIEVKIQGHCGSTIGLDLNIELADHLDFATGNLSGDAIDGDAVHTEPYLGIVADIELPLAQQCSRDGMCGS